ncbi:MAG: sulfite exporter TauE/SafE family protein [Bacteroidia bacterium]
MEPYLSYILFTCIGLVLGLIGGGGSILGVPVLVYLLHYPVDTATGYSLFIVGITSLIGAFAFVRKGDISLESILQFGIPSLLTIYCVRRFIIPGLPDVFFTAGSFPVTKQVIIMSVFSLLILSSSLSMMVKRKPNARKEVMWDEFARTPIRIYFVIVLAIFVGFLSGFVGAGGGFIIIPVLIFFVRIPIKKAVGTSLSIIAINSLIGFTGTMSHLTIDWRFLLSVSGFCISGILIGNAVSVKISTNKLKPAFGWFTLIVGIFVIAKEFFFT